MLYANPVVPQTEAYERGDWFDYTEDFVAANEEAGRLDDVVFLARIVPLLLGLGCALLLFRLGDQLFGQAAGVAAAGLWLQAGHQPRGGSQERHRRIGVVGGGGGALESPRPAHRDAQVPRRVTHRGEVVPGLPGPGQGQGKEGGQAAGAA